VLQRVAFHFFANLPQGQLRFLSIKPRVLLQYLSRSCRCLVPDTSYIMVKEFQGQVCFIACDMCYSVSDSTFSPNLPQGQLHFPSTTHSVLHQYLSRSCCCLVPGMLNTTMQKLHLEVNSIGCHTCYSASHSTFLPICVKDNSISLLLHPQFFFNIYHGHVAAWCQIRLTQW